MRVCRVAAVISFDPMSSPPACSAGKSTLLRLIMGKEQANKGRVSVIHFVNRLRSSVMQL